MAFRFEWTAEAQDDLRDLDSVVAVRILKKLQWLSAQDDPLTFLVILRQPAIGDARFRIGDYRVAVLLNRKNKIVTIAAIGHRSSIYKE